MKKKFFMHAFSLMEMMIVLLIVAIIAAASAPMISKKMMRQTGTGDSPWVFTGTGNNVAFNMNGNARDTVLIGLGGLPSMNQLDAAGNYSGNNVSQVNSIPMLIKNGVPDRANPPQNNRFDLTPAITFADDSNRIVGYLGQTSNSVYFSNFIPNETNLAANDNGSAIIGANLDIARANGVGLNAVPALTNKVIYGYRNIYRIERDSSARNCDILYGSRLNIRSDGQNQGATNANIVIGNDIRSDGQNDNNFDGNQAGNSIYNTIMIGQGQRTDGNVVEGVSLGNNTRITGTGPVAIGEGARATADRAIRIGRDVNNNNNIGATQNNAIAIGTDTIASNQNAIALGNATQASGLNAIAIGGNGNDNTSATANNTIAIGTGAQATAQNAIALGSNAQASHANSVAIGVDATTNNVQNNVQNMNNNTPRIVLGRGGQNAHTVVIPGTLRVNPGDLCKLDGTQITANDLQSPSDIRLKNVGEKLTSGLEDIKKLEFFNYTFKDDKEQKPHVGVMAQDLQKVFPISVTEGSDGYLRIRWDEMFYAALNAIKELDNKITEIKTKVTSYFDRVSKLEAQIDEQQKTIEELQKQNAEFKKRLAKIEKRGVGVKGVNNKIKTPALKSESEAE